MNEQERLQDLLSYHILDTPPEEELNELAEIASLICDTPVSLITMVDGTRQWFKTRKGVDFKETDRKLSFCQYTLDKPKEVLVVKDALKDERFKKNDLVLGEPNIRFYAGAPLETPDGNVLGTICVIDNKPRQVSEDQKKALQMLAKKTMHHLNSRKLLLHQKGQIEEGALKLKKLTDQAPVMIYEFERSEEGEMKFNFISQGIKNLHPTLDPEEVRKDASLVFSVFHPDDLPHFLESIERSFYDLSDWMVEFRVINEDNEIEWHSGRAKPEKQDDGSVIWYGTIMNVTNRVAYEHSLEQIAFDISHVLRRPVSTLLGLTSLIESEEMNSEQIKEYSAHIKAVSQELDIFSRKLNETYCKKRDIITGKNRD